MYTIHVQPFLHFQILTIIIKLKTILSRGDRLKILVKFGERDDFSQ